MGVIGGADEQELQEIEREARRLHAVGVLDERGLGDRLAVVAGIRRVRDNGRPDIAAELLSAWLGARQAHAS